MNEIKFNCDRCGRTMFTMDIALDWKPDTVHRDEGDGLVVHALPKLTFYPKDGVVFHTRANDTVTFRACENCRATADRAREKTVKKRINKPIDENLKAFYLLLKAETELARDGMRLIGDTFRHLDDAAKSCQASILRDLDESIGE